MSTGNTRFAYIFFSLLSPCVKVVVSARVEGV